MRKTENGRAIGATQAAPAKIDPVTIKGDFPIFERKIHGRRLIYLDNAATTHKPEQVLAALSSFYRYHNANVHRGLHTLAEEATLAYESTRKKAADFIGARAPEEIVFTRNATEAINLVAYSWGRANIGPGDRLVATQMEHHANLVPWIVLANRVGAELRYIPIDGNGELDLEVLPELLTPNTRLVAVTQMSNVLGTINPVREIGRFAHQAGALLLVDGAQAVPHMPVNVTDIDADFYVFSAHKMLGPTGVGVLFAKASLLDTMEPYNLGGEMISRVTFESVDWNQPPHKYEAGTPNIAGVAAFATAIDYLKQLDLEAVRNHEIDLTEYALKRLGELEHVKIFGPADPMKRGAAISFVDDKIHPHDLASVLDSRGIAIRAGHHCAQPLTNLLGQISTARASFYIYNDREDVDELIEGLKAARRFFGYA